MEVMAGVGGGGFPGSCLKAVSHTRTHAHTDTHARRASKMLLVPIERPAEKERESRCQSMHTEEAGSNITSMFSRAALHTALPSFSCCGQSTFLFSSFFLLWGRFSFRGSFKSSYTSRFGREDFLRPSGAVLSPNSGSPGYSSYRAAI